MPVWLVSSHVDSIEKPISNNDCYRLQIPLKQSTNGTLVPTRAERVTSLAPNIIFTKRKWLWFIGTIDFVSVLVISSLWCFSVAVSHAFSSGEDIADSTITFGTVMGGISQLMRFMMGLILIWAPSKEDHVSRKNFLRAYLIGSYILIGKILAVMLSSIMIPNAKLDYKGWLILLFHMMSIIFRLIVTTFIQKLLTRII